MTLLCGVAWLVTNYCTLLFSKECVFKGYLFYVIHICALIDNVLYRLYYRIIHVLLY
jgi:hypothetical protein